MDIYFLQEPLQLPIAVTATLIYAALSVRLAKLAGEPRLVAALPLFGNIVLSAYVMTSLLRALSLLKGGVLTRAAGVSEGLVFATVGATAAAVVSILVGRARRLEQARERRTYAGSWLLAIGFFGCASFTAFSWSVIRPEVVYSRRLEDISLGILVLCAGVFLLSVPVSFISLGPRSRPSNPRLWYTVFGALSLSSAVVLIIAVYRLRMLIASAPSG